MSPPARRSQSTRKVPSVQAAGTATAARAAKKRPARTRQTRADPPAEATGAEATATVVRATPFSTATTVRIVFTVAAALLFLYALYVVSDVLLLVLVAGFLAVGLDPAVRRLERFGLKRGQAVAAILLVGVVFVAGFIVAVVPPLVSQVTKFATNLPGYVQELADNNPRIAEFVEENDIAVKLREAAADAPARIAGSFGGVVGVAGSVLSSVFRVLSILVLTIYFSLSLSRIRAGGLLLVPKSKRKRVSELLDPILEKIGGYIAGNITVSVIAGIVSFAFLAIAGVPFPVALALWVAIADLIPLVGATVGAVPAVLVAFFDTTGVGVMTLIFFAFYQQFENYFIAPRVMTRAVDLSPAAVLLAALTGAALLGFVGALMAIPTAAAIKVIVEEVIRPRAEAG